MTARLILGDDEHRHEIEVAITSVVGALLANGGEMAESVGVTFADMPEGFDGLILAVESRAWAATPGRYLVFPIPVESAEAKETP